MNHRTGALPEAGLLRGAACGYQCWTKALRTLSAPTSYGKLIERPDFHRGGAKVQSLPAAILYKPLDGLSGARLASLKRDSPLAACGGLFASSESLAVSRRVFFGYRAGTH
nr:hypothetical protein [Brevundimonas naejangsanensis]